METNKIQTQTDTNQQGNLTMTDATPTNQADEMIASWLKDESEQIKANKGANYEILPTLKLVQDTITEIDVDISKAWDTWKGTDTKGEPVAKRIIPCIHNGEKKNFWLSVKNPLAKELILACAKGQTHFKILQTGNQASTKYILLK